jgi:hypothetical protein
MGKWGLTIIYGLSLLCAMGIQGCIPGKSAPTRFYLLSGPEGVAGGKQTGTHAANPEAVAVGIGPVELPHYLDRPQIVLRTGRNRMELCDFHHWGEPLEDNFSRVLAENLTDRLDMEGVTVFPWRAGAPVDFRVSVQVTRFDGMLGHTARLTARWIIFRKNESELAATKASVLSMPIQGKDHDALVKALSGLVAGLGADIAHGVGAVLSESRREGD